MGEAEKGALDTVRVAQAIGEAIIAAASQGASNAAIASGIGMALDRLTELSYDGGRIRALLATKLEPYAVQMPNGPEQAH